MTDLLVSLFIKEKEQIDRIPVRTAYGILASIVGILCNVFLFGLKFTIGFLLNSISVTADAFNNLSDAGSAFISLIGVKMAAKPADQNHPFGHGRIEYISALIIAFLVIQVGFTFFKNSIGKILHPEELHFQIASILFLILSIGVKLWLSAFNRKLGERIDSNVMKAAAADSLGDVIITAVTILAMLIQHFFHINVDGIIGIVVALLVIWTGIGIARDTLEPLIGTAADPETVLRITELVESYEGIVGSHDLIIHNYGPGRSMASLHAEVEQEADLLEIHETIDRIEREVGKTLEIFLVIHMDPIATKDARVLEIREQIHAILKQQDIRLSMHDFRLVDGNDQINLIFDLVVPYQCTLTEQQELRQHITSKISDLDKRYQCVITIEKSFIAPN